MLGWGKDGEFGEREKTQEVRSLPMTGLETGGVSNGTNFKRRPEKKKLSS